jgi:hypothetical protein
MLWLLRLPPALGRPRGGRWGEVRVTCPIGDTEPTLSIKGGCTEGGTGRACSCDGWMVGGPGYMTGLDTVKVVTPGDG